MKTDKLNYVLFMQMNPVLGWMHSTKNERNYWKN